MKKKVSLLLASIMIGSLSFAQELTSKKGENYLPEEGDWALGVDAAPFFSYLGNAFNGNTSNSSPTWSFVDNGMTIYGKYFKTADMAYRGRIKLLGINNSTSVMAVQDDTPGVDPLATKTDSKSHGEMEITLGFGIEKRKGKTRLQGFYGAEVIATFGSSSDVYSYGNDITTANPTPSTADFGDNLVAGSAARVKTRDYGTFYYFGVRPFIGAEYFIFPKMSIAGEFGYTLAYGGMTATTVTAEYYDATTSAPKDVDFNEDTPSTANFLITNDNLGGALRLMLHF